ncbi:MAG: RAMP superfamily CRISPR-associated protein, partial [bacterium]
MLESQSPLFVSDSENVYELDNGHKVYRFFKQKGEFAIPASSLRGMVRNVFEAATNSCMMHFAEDKIHGRTRPLEYRMNRAPEDAIPARVAKLDANGAILEVLDCSRDIPGSIERSLFTDKNGEFVSIIKSGAFPTYLDFVFRKEDGK